MQAVRLRVVVAAVFAAAIATPVIAAAQPPDPSVVGATAGLEFHSDFWINLHHALYAAAWDGRPDAGGARRRAGESVPLDGTLSDAERRAWDAAVAVYDREMASKDLLFDDGMMEVKFALGRAREDLSSADVPPVVREALVSAAPVYRAHGWPAQDRANRAWIAETRAHLEQLAPAVTAKLASLYGTPWPSEPVRVDAVRVANRQGAYTTIGPGWIVVSTSDPDNQDWAAVEIILHESSHLLVRPVMRALADAGRASHIDVPRVLWHVVLFYTTGEVVKQALAASGTTYVPYLYKTGLFDRAWPMYRNAIEAALPPFIAGTQSMTEMAQRLVASLPPPAGKGDRR